MTKALVFVFLGVCLGALGASAVALSFRMFQ
jgi:hypothetical protein